MANTTTKLMRRILEDTKSRRVWSVDRNHLLFSDAWICFVQLCALNELLQLNFIETFNAFTVCYKWQSHKALSIWSFSRASAKPTIIKSVLSFISLTESPWIMTVMTVLIHNLLLIKETWSWLKTLFMKRQTTFYGCRFYQRFFIGWSVDPDARKWAGNAKECKITKSHDQHVWEKSRKLEFQNIKIFCKQQASCRAVAVKEHNGNVLPIDSFSALFSEKPV